MMEKDPKFGWHTIWITPALCCMYAWSRIADRIRSRLHKRRIDAILRDNPDIRELSRLSGIKELK